MSLHQKCNTIDNPAMPQAKKKSREVRGHKTETYIFRIVLYTNGSPASTTLWKKSLLTPNVSTAWPSKLISRILWAWGVQEKEVELMVNLEISSVWALSISAKGSFTWVSRVLKGETRSGQLWGTRRMIPPFRSPYFFRFRYLMCYGWGRSLAHAC